MQRIPNKNTDKTLIEKYLKQQSSVKLNTELKNVDVGIVYVLSNRSLKGMVKIGFTKNNIQQRIKELSRSTAIPTPFNEEFSVIVENPQKLETQVFRQLKQFRVSSDKEFFRVEPEKITETIFEILYDTNDFLLGCIKQVTDILRLCKKYPQLLASTDEKDFQDAIDRVRKVFEDLEKESRGRTNK